MSGGRRQREPGHAHYDENTITDALNFYDSLKIFLTTFSINQAADAENTRVLVEKIVTKYFF